MADTTLDHIRSSLIGVWTLNSFTLTPPGGGQTLHPMSERPTAQHIFTASGHSSAQILNPGQAPYADGNPFAAADAEYIESSKRFMGWAGTFDISEWEGDVDVKGGTVVLTYGTEVVNYPNQMGKRQARKAELRDAGKVLVVSSLPGAHGPAMVYVWTKIA